MSGSWVCSIDLINFRHTQFENLAFSVDSSAVSHGPVIFIGLVDLNITSHGASEM